jgi:hypothetical protein
MLWPEPRFGADCYTAHHGLCHECGRYVRGYAAERRWRAVPLRSASGGVAGTNYTTSRTAHAEPIVWSGSEAQLVSASGAPLEVLRARTWSWNENCYHCALFTPLYPVLLLYEAPAVATRRPTALVGVRV